MHALALFVGLNHLLFACGGLLLFKRDSTSKPRIFSYVYTLVAAITGVTAWTRPSSSNFLISMAWLLATAALSLFAWSTYETREKPLTIITTADEPSCLYTTGPYAHLRHPFYTAYLANFAAAACAGRNGPVGFICFICTANLLYKHAKYEEAKFADSGLAVNYTSYSKRTAMLVPGVL